MDDLDRMLEFSALPTPPCLSEAALREQDTARKNRLTLILAAAAAALYMLALAVAGVYVLLEFPQAAKYLFLALVGPTLCALVLCVSLLLPGRTNWVNTLMGG